MQHAVKSIQRALNVSEAFRNTLTDDDSQHDYLPSSPFGRSGVQTFDDNWYNNSDRKTLNMGGLEIPLIEGELNRAEKLFLQSAEYGDAATVKRLIDNAKAYSLNVNCMDAMGRGVLRIAIETEHIELLQMLLTYEAIELRDILLHAISEEQVQSVELILQAQSERSQRKNLKGLLGHIQSSSFTPDITPLILAAHRDNYVIIKMLLDRGNRISKPHEMRCACNACVQASKEDSLQHSKLRINAYRALSSPCFIALSSRDPILTAFELSWELKRLGHLENEFKDDYEKLSISCQTFATALLAQTRGSAELAVVLNHESGSRDINPTLLFGVKNETACQIMQLSRLKLAIKYKQKMFVTHPHCQQLLASLWYDGLPGFRRKPFLIQATTILLICILFPFFSLAYLLAPESRWGSMMRKPFIMFLCQSSTYVSFLGLLTLVAVRIEFLMTDAIEVRMSSRDPLPSFIESIVIIYIIGFVWQEISSIWNLGVRTYVMDMWHLLDFLQNSLYISTIAMRLVAWIRVNVYKEKSFADRGEWDAYDPILISESLFAIANIFATLKLVYVFTVSPQLGPLQISLGRMLNDILKFFCVYILVMVAFAFGLNQLYWFYAKNRADSCVNVRFSLDDEKKDVYAYCSTRGRYFTNLFEIVQTLYWSAYGLIDLTNLDLEYPHFFTEFIGKLIFGTYSCIAFIVLLNMLIAMMNNSYQLIAEKADVEWKFARSKLWISYFAEGTSLPVPFNLLPGRYTFTRLFQKCRCPCQKLKIDQAEAEWHTKKEKVQIVNEKEESHTTVMRELVNRYLMHRQMNDDGQGVTEDDLNEIKGDISAFRYEILDILRANGFKVNSQENMKKGGKLRRRASKRGQMTSWKAEDLNLDNLTGATTDKVICNQMQQTTIVDTGAHPDIIMKTSAGAETDVQPQSKMSISCDRPGGPSNNPCFVGDSPVKKGTKNTVYSSNGDPEMHSDDLNSGTTPSLTAESFMSQHQSQKDILKSEEGLTLSKSLPGENVITTTIHTVVESASSLGEIQPQSKLFTPCDRPGGPSNNPCFVRDSPLKKGTPTTISPSNDEPKMQPDLLANEMTPGFDIKSSMNQNPSPMDASISDEGSTLSESRENVITTAIHTVDEYSSSLGKKEESSETSQILQEPDEETNEEIEKEPIKIKPLSKPMKSKFIKTNARNASSSPISHTVRTDFV